MLHFERRAMLLAADQLDGMNKLFRIGIVQQEREALDGFVSEAAAAGFFPRQVLVIEIYLVTRASKLLAARGPGGPAAYDCNLRHTCLSPRPFPFLSRTNPSHESLTAGEKGLLG